jgi:predicted ribonuclease YlaK
VVIVDEASTCSTHDLDAITADAKAARTKVVFVGDPAQIGVVEGPGGLLAALADRTGSIELTVVHRFTQQWERTASLALRRGDPSDDAAVDAVFTAWGHRNRHW